MRIEFFSVKREPYFYLLAFYDNITVIMILRIPRIEICLGFQNARHADPDNSISTSKNNTK